jgi:D-alanyl-D-alanine carboxypeptidase
LLSARLTGALERARHASGAPAATAAVAHRGAIVWSGASGTVRAGVGRLATEDTMFVLASCSKVITAALVMSAIEAGRLSLETPISSFYPQLPNAASITIAQLLGHTSGLGEYTDAVRFAELAGQRSRRWTRDQVLGLIEPAQFAPGGRFAYTNSNYVVLGGVLEQITGATIESLFQERIARPLELSDSTFAYGSVPMRRFAHPHETADGALKDRFAPKVGISTDYWGEVWTDGGLASNALELARMMDALFAARSVSHKTLRLMMTPGRGHYGLGLRLRTVRGRTWWGHTGSYGGFESQGWHDSGRAVTIVALTNRDEPRGARETTSGRIWDGLARAYDRWGNLD